MLKPNSNQTSLIADFQDKCEMSTFMDNDNILIKVASRFVIFNKDSHFIDEVEFKDIRDG